MHGEHQGNPVVELCHNPAQMGVPGVEMHDVGVYRGGVPIQAPLQGAENRVELLGRGVSRDIDAEPGGLERGGVQTRFPEVFSVAPHLHLHHPGELTAQIIHVNARAAVNRGRELVSQKKRLHKQRTETSGATLGGKSRVTVGG